MPYYEPLVGGPIYKEEYRAPYSIIPYDYTRAIIMVQYPNIKRSQYAVSTEGQVFNVIRQTTLSQAYQNGYAIVSLPTIDGNITKVFVHRLVAYAFCNPPKDIENYVVNHIDGNKLNNCCGNLEWISNAANLQHAKHILYPGAYDPGRPEATESMIRYICEQFVLGKTDTEIMRDMGLNKNEANISFLQDLRHGRSWRGIASQYKFRKESGTKVYSAIEKELIKKYLRQGIDNFYQIYELVEGIKYVPCNESKRKINAIMRVRGSIYKELSEIKKENYNA